jgi:hypothetical protein
VGEEVPEGEDVEGSGEGGSDGLVTADETGGASVLLALAVLLSEPDHIYGVTLLRQTSLATTAKPPSLLDQFPTLLT